MTFTVSCLGACREVGRSAFMVETDRKILMDYGIKIFDRSGQPKYPEGFREEFPKGIDLAVLSHAHLDHSGFLPYLYSFSKVKWMGTPPTHDMAEILLPDSMRIMGDKLPYNETQFNKAMKYWVPAALKQSVPFGESEVKFFDAGHIAGAAMVELGYKGKTFFYTGDFKTEDTRMHDGAEYGKEVDALMLDCTYAEREHPDRKKTERKFTDEIAETLDEGGNVLLPAFAVGRTQELIRIIRAYDKDVPVYVDGMGKDINRIYAKYPKYVRDIGGFRKDLESITGVTGDEGRKDALGEPSVVIATAGMLEGGPALRYLLNLNPKSKILFTGYSVEGTNGWRLLNENKLSIDGNLVNVDLPVEYYDFSAHAGRSDLLGFIKKVSPQKIICVHGDNTAEFAEELRKDYGYDAVAPAVGETIEA